jgi:hypothetical protein
MAVIINELEIVVEPPEAEGPDAAAAAERPAPRPASVEPQDLIDFLERRSRLSERLLAH